MGSLSRPGAQRIRAAAAAQRPLRADSPSTRTDAAILIRWAYPDDTPEIARLAQLDEAPIPPAPLLLGEVGGELWAALSVDSRTHIADPFHPSAQVVDLLRERARQLHS